MEKNERRIFRISLLLNALLIPLVIWGYLMGNYLRDQVSLVEVQYHLLKLEGAIEEQSRNDWVEPSSVIHQMKDALNEIWRVSSGDTISDDDKYMFARLHRKLSAFPQDEANFTDQDKRKFEELREILHDLRMDLNGQADDSRMYLLNQASELEQKIQPIHLEQEARSIHLK